MDEDYRQLLEKAREALKFSYAPYSNLRVGAALLANGKTFLGANYECVSYGLSICAERSAILNANMAGAKDIEAIAVVSDKGAITPCGACRQFIYEASMRCGRDIKVVFESENEIGIKTKIEIKRISELLPEAFGII
jgi:cytidine deaminase